MTILCLMSVSSSTMYVPYRLTCSYSGHHDPFVGAHGQIALPARVYGRRGVGRAGQQVLPVAPQTTPRPARAAAQRVSVGSDGLRPASDDGWAWPNQRRSRPNAGGQPSYGRRASRAPRRCLARAVDAGACHRPRPVRCGQAHCLARGLPYDVFSRPDDLTGARSHPPSQQPSVSPAWPHGSGPSWQQPRRDTESGQKCPFSTF